MEELCKQRLDPATYDFYAGGSGQELTLTENAAAWERLRLRPRVLNDVSHLHTETTVLGTRIAAPIVVAPTAYQVLAHSDGEVATSRGAAAAGSLMVISSRASVTLEAIAGGAPDAPRWFQVYVLRDRRLTEELVRRAVAIGCTALVLTVDAPYLGVRSRDRESSFVLPKGIQMVNLTSVVTADLAEEGEHRGLEQDPAVTFDDIQWLRDVANLPVVVKGVLRSDDAVRCVEHGAAAVVVSNHGGRQLDGVVPTAQALPEIAAAVAGEVEVYVDGGVRRGSDVIKALALGARAVMVGRPVLWGLAVAGAEGVRDVLDQLRQELVLDLALCGVSRVEDVSPDLIA